MEGLTPNAGPPMRHCSKGNHDLADTPENFCGAYRWCRGCFKAYRTAWRKKARAKILEMRASNAELCVVCDSKPIVRKGALRCPACIAAHRYRCKCSRISSNPSCGKCRGIKLRASKAAKREAALAQRMNVFTGDGTCAKCGAQLSRDEYGNVNMAHACV
jgi:hypothetical protein